MFLIGCVSPPALEATATVDATYGTLVRVAWEQATTELSWVEAEFDGEVVTTPATVRGAGSAEQRVLGLPYATDVTLTLYVGNDAYVIETSTDTAPVGMPIVTSVEGDAARYDASSPYFLVSVTDGQATTTPLDAVWWVMIVDRRGRVVWARPTDTAYTSLHPRVSADGRSLLIDEASWWAGAFDDGAASRIVRMSIDGTIASITPTPGLHHPFTDREDGTLVWGARSGSVETIEVARPWGERERLWDCTPWMEQIGARRGDYCGSNTLVWSDARASYLWSSYSFHTIVEIDEEGQMLQWYGAAAGSVPTDPVFHWQHGVHWTPAGTLLVSEHDVAADSEIVVREYAYDGQALTEVWSFGVGDGVLGRYMGEPWRLENGDTLHNTGSEPRIREATADGEVVWDITWNDGVERWLGRSTPIPDLYTLLE